MRESPCQRQECTINTCALPFPPLQVGLLDDMVGPTIIALLVFTTLLIIFVLALYDWWY
jgi:hypothetical protein